jgi:hypothetical protein
MISSLTHFVESSQIRERVAWQALGVGGSGRTVFRLLA